MSLFRRLVGAAAICASFSAHAETGWRFEGTKQILVHSRDGKTTNIGTVSFKPDGNRIAFKTVISSPEMKTYFLSMRDFKCLNGDEVTCHVPYPYANSGYIESNDFSWLEMSLLFLTKSPREFGAKMENGVYFSLRLADGKLIGTPQRIDLNLIASPPEDLSVPPYSQVERRDEPTGARWIDSISIENTTP